MSTQRADRLPPSHVPEPDASILTRRSQRLAVGREPGCVDSSRVPTERVPASFLAEPPEVAPLDPAQVFLVSPGPLPLQQFPRPHQVARLPRLLGDVHVRGIAQVALMLRCLLGDSLLFQ